MEIEESLIALGQEHVLGFASELAAEERQALASQLAGFDLELLAQLARGEGLVQTEASPQREPASVVALNQEPAGCTRAEASARGERLLRDGHVGIFLVAGGQGTRLGFPGPKGCLSVGPLSGKTLFELHAEKIAALRSRFGCVLPWYIMTSASNDADTRQFFADHDFFGLDRENVVFFAQDMQPALDADGKLFLESKGRVFTSPNGHGGSYAAFRKSGALAHAEGHGVEHLFYFQVDNCLIQMADPLFLGLHDLVGSEMSLKVVRKTGPREKVGNVALENGRPKVVEYSDFSEEESTRTDADGNLAYWAGSIGIHAFRLDFFIRVGEGTIPLPYHLAHKKIDGIDDKGQPTEVDGRKYELFIFDALPHAKRSLNLEVRREAEFAPIKNMTGVDSLDSARDLLEAEHRGWLREHGVEVRGRLEIAPSVALQAADLAGKLDGAKAVYEGDVSVQLDDNGKVEFVTS